MGPSPIKKQTASKDPYLNQTHTTKTRQNNVGYDNFHAFLCMTNASAGLNRQVGRPPAADHAISSIFGTRKSRDRSKKASEDEQT